MTFYFVKIIQSLLMPPALMFIIILAGLISLRWSKRYGKIISISGLLLLVAASLPIVTQPLINAMEYIPALDSRQIKTIEAEAIVILGGGSYLAAPEYGGDTVSTATLERIRYGAYLHKQTTLPILVTGGRVYDYIKIAEASLMKSVLENDFQTPVRWPEEKSRNTWENAQYSQQMLKRENITKIILVTHALHMPRAIMCFEAAGFEVTPAPLAFHSRNKGFAVSDIIHNSCMKPSAYSGIDCVICETQVRIEFP